MKKRTIKLSILLLLIAAPCLAEDLKKQMCASKAELEANTVLIEDEGIPRGSATLYDESIVIANKTLVWDRMFVDIYVPSLGYAVVAKKVYSQRKPDIAFLKLEEPIPNTKSLTMATSIRPNKPLFFTSFPLKDKQKRRTSIVQYVQKTKFADEKRTNYFQTKYRDWAFSGDGGGAYYNCEGKLTGVGFGNFQFSDQEKTLNAYAINTRALQNAMIKAKIPVRRY